MGLNKLLFIRNIHAAFKTMNTLLRQTSPLFEQYLNKCSEVYRNKIGTVSLGCSLFNLFTLSEPNRGLFKTFC